MDEYLYSSRLQFEVNLDVIHVLSYRKQLTVMNMLIMEMKMSRQ